MQIISLTTCEYGHSYLYHQYIRKYPYCIFCGPLYATIVDQCQISNVFLGYNGECCLHRLLKAQIWPTCPCLEMSSLSFNTHTTRFCLSVPIEQFASFCTMPSNILIENAIDDTVSKIAESRLPAGNQEPNFTLQSAASSRWNVFFWFLMHSLERSTRPS